MTPFTKSQFLRIIRALRRVMHDAEHGPDVVIGSALARWCKESFPGLPRSGLRVNAQLQLDPAIISFVNFLKDKDLLEAIYWLSTAYAQLAGDERREHLAMFFTPPSLTKRLLDDLSASGVDFTARQFCDPACGGAAFLAPIAMRMREGLRARKVSPQKIVDHVQKHVLGYDKEPALCKLSKHFLLMVLHDEVVSAKAKPTFQVHECDSLLQTHKLLGTVDIVVCNPPFRKMPAAEVAQYRDDFAEILEGQPNLYALFIALCVKLVAPSGICALVTPTSFLSGQNFSKLRMFLLKQTTVLTIGMVSDRFGVFIDVEQETALTLVRRENDGHAPTTEAEVSVVARDGNYVDVGRCVLPNSGAAWPIPRTEEDVVLLKTAATSQATLTNYGYVARIGAFVWNRDTRTTYPTAKSAARARGGTAVPLLWSSDIAADGTLRFTGSSKANREHCFINPETKNHPSVVRRPSVLLQRVTSNDQPRRLVAAAVPEPLFKKYGGFIGENHTVILEQVSDKPALAPELFAELLATPTVDRYFRCISGATNVSIFELCQLRLPDPEKLTKLLAKGFDMPRAAREALED